MNTPITLIFATVYSVLFLGLTFVVINYRQKNKIILGDANQPALTHRIRAHGNTAEYGPLAILLVLIGELNKVNSSYLIVAASLFMIGRIIYTFTTIALHSNPKVGGIRILGMTLTLVSIITLVIFLLIKALYA